MTEVAAYTAVSGISFPSTWTSKLFLDPLLGPPRAGTFLPFPSPMHFNYHSKGTHTPPSNRSHSTQWLGTSLDWDSRTPARGAAAHAERHTLMKGNFTAGAEKSSALQKILVLLRSQALISWCVFRQAEEISIFPP